MAEIDLTGTKMPQTEDALDEKLQKCMRYAMEHDQKTGEIKIYPMNGTNYITIHGIEDARRFTNHLLDYFQTE